VTEIVISNIRPAGWEVKFSVQLSCTALNAALFCASFYKDLHEFASDFDAR